MTKLSDVKLLELVVGVGPHGLAVHNPFFRQHEEHYNKLVNKGYFALEDSTIVHSEDSRRCYDNLLTYSAIQIRNIFNRN